MKQQQNFDQKKKEPKVVKGTSSAVVLSIVIHAALFILAGAFVVFKIVQKEEVVFEPPKKIERPKMKLRRPKVRVKKSSKPKTTRIVSKVPRATMPDIQLPEVSGMGDALDVGGMDFDLMPDMEEITLVGGGQSGGNDLEGTFYDFKRRRDGGKLVVAMSEEAFVVKLAEFVKKGFDRNVISKYYQSPRKLYATCVMVPTVRSSVAPLAFGEDTEPYVWMILYQGKLVYPEPITFRFWGSSDDILDVQVDGKLVLAANWPGGLFSTDMIGDFWHSDAPESGVYYLGKPVEACKAVVGDWITLEPGKPLDIKIMIGEVPGGSFAAMLNVEVKGETYPLNNQGGPILPMFKTAVPSLALRDQIIENLNPGDTDIMGGPVFRDFIPDAVATDTNKEDQVVDVETSTNENQVAKAPVDLRKKMRTWHLADGKTIQAEYRSTMGKNIILKEARNKVLKIPLTDFADNDRYLLELANPPRFNIDFPRHTDTESIPLTSWELTWGMVQAKIEKLTFKVRLKQTSSGVYNHNLTVDYYAIGRQRQPNEPQLFLIEHQVATFNPAKLGKDRTFTLSGKENTLLNFIALDQQRGRKYRGYLVVVTDERGVVIAQQASPASLFDIWGELRKLPIGAFFDLRTGKRVPPSNPKKSY